MSHNTSAELNWQTWLVKGDQYLRASKSGSNTNRFGTEIVYNLLSMSLEVYIMAVLDKNHALPITPIPIFLMQWALLWKWITD